MISENVERRTGRLCPFPTSAQQDGAFSICVLEGQNQPYQAPDILSACNLKKLEPNLFGMVVASSKLGERRRLSRVIAPMPALVQPCLFVRKTRQSL